MIEIMYRPEDVGKLVLNSRGGITKIRKYHMTEVDIARTRQRWLLSIVGVDKKIKRKAGTHFFNPYRKGIYYYQIQSMYLLGTNTWHSLNDILQKMEEIMSQVFSKKNGISSNAWGRFRGKANKDDAIKCKDYIGRVQENMVFFQRLTKLHPYGYKLRQVRASVDTKRVTKAGFPNGCYSYRLSTYKTEQEALPTRDYSKFVFPRHERKYVSYKFIGTIITKDKVISEGKIYEMSPVSSG